MLGPENKEKHVQILSHFVWRKERGAAQADRRNQLVVRRQEVTWGRDRCEDRCEDRCTSYRKSLTWFAELLKQTRYKILYYSVILKGIDIYSYIHAFSHVHIYLYLQSLSSHTHKHTRTHFSVQVTTAHVLKTNFLHHWLLCVVSRGWDWGGCLLPSVLGCRNQLHHTLHWAPASRHQEWSAPTAATRQQRQQQQQPHPVHVLSASTDAVVHRALQGRHTPEAAFSWVGTWCPCNLPDYTMAGRLMSL